MDATQAMARTHPLVDGLVAGLTSDDREARTPCDKWSVHDLIEHMCQGGEMVALGLNDSAPEGELDVLADGPAAGWAAASAALRSAATTEALAATHKMPFGDVPGEMALSVITADHLTHAWDLARATGQSLSVDDELAGWALETWRAVVPAEGRTGDGFAAVVAVPEDASALDHLVGYTGRRP